MAAARLSMPLAVLLMVAAVPLIVPTLPLMLVALLLIVRQDNRSSAGRENVSLRSLRSMNPVQWYTGGRVFRLSYLFG
jgi:uncharacterized membrane protein